MTLLVLLIAFLNFWGEKKQLNYPKLDLCTVESALVHYICLRMVSLTVQKCYIFRSLLERS